jgi:DNA-binding LacI/PurR family transcriptional regulator
MARAAVGWGIRDLAREADVAVATVSRFEGGAGVRSRTIDAMRRAFERAGIVFIPENGGGAGVRLRERAKDAPG